MLTGGNGAVCLCSVWSEASDGKLEGRRKASRGPGSAKVLSSPMSGDSSAIAGTQVETLARILTCGLFIECGLPQNIELDSEGGNHHKGTVRLCSAFLNQDL